MGETLLHQAVIKKDEAKAKKLIKQVSRGSEFAPITAEFILLMILYPLCPALLSLYH